MDVGCVCEAFMVSQTSSVEGEVSVYAAEPFDFRLWSKPCCILWHRFFVGVMGKGSG